MNYQIKNILVPIDFSEASNNALQMAIAMANRHKAAIHLLHIVQPQLIVDPAGLHTAVPGIEQTLLQDAKENIEKHKAIIQKTNQLVVSTHVEIGTVAICISNYVLNDKKDLVVMGTHGTSGWSEFFWAPTLWLLLRNVAARYLPYRRHLKKEHLIPFYTRYET
ncbi:MAG: universal stress protein [Bacteroidia bacterium]|nr:universal stress protein [Bacteroidia bacterium]